jgi:hypothetical protein
MFWSAVAGSGSVVVLTISFVIFLWKTFLQDAYKAALKDAFDHHLEATRFDYNRLAQGFTLYNTRRHEAYAEVLENLLQAEGYIYDRLQKLQSRPSFEDYDVVDLEKYMEVYNVTHYSTERIKRMWEADNRRNAIEELEKYERIHINRHTKRLIDAANNSVLRVELYCSQESLDKANKIVRFLREAAIELESRDKTTPNPDYQTFDEKARELADSAHKLIDELRVQMKSELHKGYFGQEKI